MGLERSKRAPKESILDIRSRKELQRVKKYSRKIISRKIEPEEVTKNATRWFPPQPAIAGTSQKTPGVALRPARTGHGKPLDPAIRLGAHS